MALGAPLDNCLCLFFARRDSITIAGVPFVYDVVLVQCKKKTKFGGVPNIHGAHAIFRLGKPSFKKKIYSYM